MFDYQKIYDLPDEILSLAINEADTYLQQQQMELSRLDSKCLNIFNAGIAIEAALLGGTLVSLSSSSEIMSRMIWPMCFGLVIAAAIVVVIISTTMFRRKSCLGGRQPNEFFSEKTLELISQADPEKVQVSHLHKVYYLADIQEAINFNFKETGKRIRGYRASVVLLFLGVSGTVLASIIIAFAG